MSIDSATRDEWIKNVKPANGFLRAGSVRIYRSVEGTGIAPGIDAYPHQYLDVGFNQEDMPDWQRRARMAARIANDLGVSVAPVLRAGNQKHSNARTPLDTSVAVLAREGHDMLSSACGYCTKNLAACKCGQQGPSSG